MSKCLQADCAVCMELMAAPVEAKRARDSEEAAGDKERKVAKLAPVKDEENSQLRLQALSGSAGVELTVENFREEAFSQLKKELAKFGNPAAYLRSRYPSSEAREAFAEDLRKHFPPREDMVYRAAGDLPPNTTEQFNLHLCDLSFQEWASTKGPPFLVTCNLLLDEYICNNFLTEGS